MKIILTLLLGIILGGVLVYFLFVGAPGARQLTGTPVREPDAAGPPPGTATVELDEQFFNTLLGKIFADLGQPTFRLASARPTLNGEGRVPGVSFVKAQAEGCQSQVVILPEGGGVQTGVRLMNGQILAPLAFAGTYNAPIIGCQQFRGTAEANIQLSFRAEEQTLYGQLNIAGVNLEGMSPLLSGPVTLFVQNVLNQRVNPLTLMSGGQIALSVPVQATGGTLEARAKDVRSEINDGRLRLHITYDFEGAKGAAPPAG